MGGGQKVGATWETQALSVTPNGCNQPTPAVTRRRGVEDAAPYGRVLDVSVRIVVNRCVNAANLRPPLGSPERGAVAARRAVTEGLRPAWIYPPASPPVVGEGFHALPAWEDGLPRIAYNKWCAGCAREIAYVGRWTRGRRTVGDVGAVGHAQRMRLTHHGNSTAQGASRTPPPYGGCDTNAAACMERVRFPTPTNGARAVPAGYNTLSGG